MQPARVRATPCCPPPIQVPGADGPSCPAIAARPSPQKTPRAPPPARPQVLGADGLIYQDVADLVECGTELNGGITEFDDSCFTGGRRALLVGSSGVLRGMGTRPLHRKFEV